MKLTSVLLMLVVALVAASLIGPLGGCGGKDQTTLVAGNLPLTGPIAAFSGRYPLGFEMGLSDVSTSGATVAIDFQDNAGNARTAVSVMQQQLLKKPAAYISGTTQMTEAILGRINELAVPHFLVSFDAFMTQSGPEVLRVLPSFKIEAPLFVTFIQKNKGQRVFFITPNLKAYLEQSDKLILPEVGRLGIDYRRELFEFGQEDFRSIALKVKEYRPDVIVASGYAFHLYPTLRALVEQGILPQVPTICTMDFIDIIHGDFDASDFDGVSFVSPHCEIPGKVAGYAEWRERFIKAYGEEPSYVDAYAYDTARVVAAAAGDGLTTASVLKQFPFDGVTGRLELDDTGDLLGTLTIGRLDGDGVVVDYE